MLKLSKKLIKIKKLFIPIILSLLLLFIVSIPGCMGIRMNKKIYTKPKNIPKAYTVIVLGAMVHKNHLSWILEDRMIRALELYKLKKVSRFLLSGDHGTKEYDEVNSMKKYLLKKGVKKEDIFLDHAGFNTYNTMVRAKKIFNVDSCVVVTQKFHLPRALYIAQKAGLHANGYIANKRKYPGIRYYRKREYLARIKSYFEVLVSAKPKFLGSEIPITGNYKKSWD